MSEDTLVLPRSVNATAGLRAALDDRGLRYSWVAERIGVSRPFFSMVLGGERKLGVERARHLADLIGADFFSLFDTSASAETASVVQEGVGRG